MKNQIIVTGFHSSGTSLVGRILESGGYNVRGKIPLIRRMGINGQKLYEEKREDVHIVCANESALRKAGGGWMHPISITPNTTEIEKIIGRFEIPWAIKDPRFCLTYPFLIRKPDLLFCFRNPNDCANSMVLRSGKDQKYWIYLWQIYFQSIYPFLSIDRCLRYEKLIDRCDDEILRLEQFTGQKYSCALVDSNRRHHDTKILPEFEFLTNEQKDFVHEVANT